MYIIQLNYTRLKSSIVMKEETFSCKLFLYRDLQDKDIRPILKFLPLSLLYTTSAPK